jgi:Flp pilus assembly protein TadG
MGAHPTRREDGQTLVIMCLVMIVLLGFAALVVEGGNAFLQRRQMQGTADAAAMAGVQQITQSRTAADTVARDYVVNQNSDAGGAVDQLVTTGSGTASCNGVSMKPYSVCVRARRTRPSLLGSLLGSSHTVAAQAVATASQVKSMKGWLPFGVMDNQYVSGTEVSFRPGSVSPAGSINTPAGPSCSFYGGNGVRDVIKSAAFGGADACPIDVGQKIETQTGVTSGVLNQGFDDRLNGNTDSFSDVFEYDPVAQRYLIKLPNSPRLGIVPLAGGTGNWPLSSGQEMVVAGYVFVYIGDRSRPGYPPLTGSGSALRIHLTPVNALLPTDWDTVFSDYDPSAHGIVAYHLVS